MKMANRLLLVVPMALAACAHVQVVEHVVEPVPEAIMQPGQALITRLVIDFTPVAQKQVDQDPRFSSQFMRKATSQVLTARKLADLQNNAVVRVAVIELDEYDVRTTANLVVQGRVASAAVVGATVRVRDGSGTQLGTFHIRTEMTINVSLSSSNPLEKLYRQFAMLVADDLTGTAKPKQKQPKR